MSKIRTSLSTKQPRHTTAVFVVCALVAYGLDQWSKHVAIAKLGDGQVVPILDIPGFGSVLSLHLIGNPGASLGFASQYTPILGAFAAFAGIALCVLGLLTRNRWWSIAFALAGAGALGNFTDRVLYASSLWSFDGQVVDFLNYGWSIGNVADIWLTCAAVMVVVLVVRGVPAHITRGSLSRS